MNSKKIAADKVGLDGQEVAIVFTEAGEVDVSFTANYHYLVGTVDLLSPEFKALALNRLIVLHGIAISDETAEYLAKIIDAFKA